MSIYIRGVIYPKIRFKCTLCGECCKRYWIPITHIDLVRISEYTGFDIEDFTTLFNKEMTSGWDYPEIKLKSGTYYLVLKKHLDNTCIFNKYIRGNLICEIHEIKPFICRFYPFTYWFDGDVIKFEVYEKAIDFCPGLGKGSYNTFEIEVKSAIQLKIAKEEFHKIISKWNKLFEKGIVKGEIEEFYNYLRNVLKNLEWKY